MDDMSDTTTDPEAVGATEVHALLLRVSKLEETVEALRDTENLETRIVERLRSRHDPAEDVGRASQPVHPQETDVVHPSQQTPSPSLSSDPVKSPWLLFDMFREFTNMLAMLFDMSFHLGWTTRVIVIVILAVMMTCDWWMFPINVIPFGIGTKIVNLLLGFVLFKVVSWETRRYVSQRRV